MAEEEAKNLETPVVETEAPVEAEEKFAKAGKKSKKHVEEVKAEEERQRKESEEAEQREKELKAAQHRTVQRAHAMRDTINSLY